MSNKQLSLRIEMIGAYNPGWVMHSIVTEYPRARRDYDSYIEQWPRYSWRLKDARADKILMTFIGKLYKPRKPPKRDSAGRFTK